jgi:hypothetical protein
MQQRHHQWLSLGGARGMYQGGSAAGCLVFGGDPGQGFACRNSNLVLYEGRQITLTKASQQW